MTKYTDKKYFASKKDIIIASKEEIEQIDNRSTNTGRTYSCEFCSRTLVKLIDSSGQNISYYCNFCNTTFV